MRRAYTWVKGRLTPARAALLTFVATAAVLWTLPPRPVGVITTEEEQQILGLSPDGHTLATGTYHIWYGNAGGWNFEPGGLSQPVTDLSLWDVDTGRRTCRYAIPA